MQNENVRRYTIQGDRVANGTFGTTVLNITGNLSNNDVLVADGSGGLRGEAYQAYTEITHTFNNNKYENTSLPDDIYKIDIQISDCVIATNSNDAFVGLYLGTSTGYSPSSKGNEVHVGSYEEGLHFSTDLNAPVVEWGSDGSNQRAWGTFSTDIASNNYCQVEASHWRTRTDSSEVYYTDGMIFGSFVGYSSNIRRLKIVGSRYDRTKNTTEYNITSGKIVIRYWR